MAEHTRLPLSRERVVAAALDLVDEHGAADLTMRRLGERLGVEAMSLYRHVPSKTALLHAVAEAVLSDVTPPDPRDPDWREQVLASARSFRAVIGEHPRVMPLIHSLGPASPALVALWEASLAMWVSAGADPYTAAQLHVAVGGYAIGAPLWEASLVRGTKQDSDEPAAAFVASADRLRRELAFELGLGLLLDGIESELARRQSASPPDPIDLAA